MTNHRHPLPSEVLQYRKEMWQVTPYSKTGKRLTCDKYLDKLLHHATKAELSSLGMLIYCRDMCIKHGYPTAF